MNTGRFMLLALLMAASLHRGLASVADSTPPQPCQVLEVETLDAETLPTGELTVPVLLNGHPHRWLIDTGSRFSSIPREVAQQLGVTTQFAPLGEFLNSAGVTQVGYLNSFGFAHLSSYSKWFVLIDPEDLLSPSLSGLLGADVMSNYDVEFNFFAGKVNFFRPNTCPNPVYWASAYSEVPIFLDPALHLVVDAMLDGKPVKVALDTGSPSSIMDLDTARSLFGWRKDDPRVQYKTTARINGGPPAPLYAFPFGALNFGGVAVMNPKIQLIPRENFDPHGSDNTDIVLGMSVLRQLHLYIGYQSKKLYLTGAEAH